MIEELRIRDLGVIVDTTLNLGPGFTAITGETGAGKTMVVTALGLLMGERSDTGAVRSGASQARVSGVVHTTDPAVIDVVDEVGGDIENSELLIGRTVSLEGRSRATIGGTTAPVGKLGNLAEHLFTVHGQSEQLRLRSPAAQRQTLDRFGGEPIARALAAFQAAHQERQDVAARLTELATAHDERASESARLKAALEEISAVDPQPGEENELATRIELLSNVEDLRAGASTACEALASESDAPFTQDAVTLLERAKNEIARVAVHDAKLAPHVDLLSSVSFQLSDLARELAAYATDLDQEGPGELAKANERLAAINKLLSLYGSDTAAVIAYGASAVERVTELDGDDDRIEELRERLGAVAAQEEELAAALTALRTEAAETLSERVTRELRELALPDASFVVEIRQTDLGRHGQDETLFLLGAHAGAVLRPVAKGASGGELSRVMLALEVVVANVDPVPTFVFDEVDAGVGGAAAIEVGRRLARLAQASQVIVVTHLAQVAAFANNHLRIVKDSAGGFTESSCQQLTGDDRLAEMARLLSGLSDSSSALEHAAELLEIGRDI